MGCCPGKQYETDEQKYGIVSDTPCGVITEDLLSMWKRLFDCYLQYGLFAQIGSSKAELESAQTYLVGFIEQKKLNPEDCTGMESLPVIRSLIDKIVQKGMCL